MLAYCWPIVHDHGLAVKQHWLKVSFLQGTPATQYPDTAERKYILDLQVNKYCLLAALWQEETGRQLKSSKCLVYQGADIAF